MGTDFVLGCEDFATSLAGILAWLVDIFKVSPHRPVGWELLLTQRTLPPTARILVRGSESNIPGISWGRLSSDASVLLLHPPHLPPGLGAAAQRIINVLLLRPRRGLKLDVGGDWPPLCPPLNLAHRVPKLRDSGGGATYWCYSHSATSDIVFPLKMLPEILLNCEGDGTLWTPVPGPWLHSGHPHWLLLLALEHLVNLLADDVLYSVPFLLWHEAARQQVAVTVLDLKEVLSKDSNNEYFFTLWIFRMWSSRLLKLPFRQFTGTSHMKQISVPAVILLNRITSWAKVAFLWNRTNRV